MWYLDNKFDGIDACNDERGHCFDEDEVLWRRPSVILPYIYGEGTTGNALHINKRGQYFKVYFDEGHDGFNQARMISKRVFEHFFLFTSISIVSSNFLLSFLLVMSGERVIAN